MLLSMILFVIGLIAFALAGKSVLRILFCLELMLLAASLFFLVASTRYVDSASSVLSLLAISIAGAESAIGLALVVGVFRMRGSLAQL